MLRFLIKFLLLSIIAVVSLMLLAQWRLNDRLESFSREAGNFVDLRYESANISYTGEIKINSIVAYIESYDISVEIGELRFSVGSLADLILFETKLADRQIPEKAYVVVEDLLLPFNQKLVKAFNRHQTTSSYDVLRSAACGKTSKFGIKEFEAMGYHYFAVDSESYYMLDKYSGSVVVNGKTNVEDAMTLEYQVNIGGVLSWLESQKQRAVGQTSSAPLMPSLSLLELRFIDNGYNEKKARLCALREGIDVDSYYSKHVQTVVQMLEDAGLPPSDSFRKLYPELISPESEFYWFMQPKAGFKMSGFTFYNTDELVNLSGLRLTVNKKPISFSENAWDYKQYQSILEREKARVEALEPKLDQYEQVVVKRAFVTVPSTSASRYIDLKAKVIRQDGTLYEGKITKSNDKSVWILMRSRAGEVTLPIPHSEIKKFEVFAKVN